MWWLISCFLKPLAPVSILPLTHEVSTMLSSLKHCVFKEHFRMNIIKHTLMIVWYCISWKRTFVDLNVSHQHMSPDYSIDVNILKFIHTQHWIVTDSEICMLLNPSGMTYLVNHSINKIIIKNIVCLINKIIPKD